MIEEFNIFERNKVPLEIKLAAIAMYIFSSSFRRISLILNIGKSSVHCCEKSKNNLDYNDKEKVKKLAIGRLAMDETILKYNGKKCYLFV